MRLILVSILCGTLALAGCGPQETPIPPPFALTESAIGNYCGMNVLEHAGPKGQIILASRIDPVWFSSARDTIAFTMLPEEPKDFRAIYVSDMAKAESWENPGATNWIDARKAFFVLESRRKGGMGVDEAVPFSDRTAAEGFAAEHGGHVVTFAEMPRDYILNAGLEAAPANERSTRSPVDRSAKTGHSH